jgi:hypothetical protein
MKTHDRVHEWVPLYALDALEGEDEVAVAKHVELCDACSDELSRHRSVAGTLVPDDGPAAAVWGRIVGEIDADGGDRPIDLDEVRPRRSNGLTWLASVAAAVSLVLGGVVVAQRATLSELSGVEGIVTAAEEAAAEPEAIVAELGSDAGVVARVVLTADGEGFVVPTDLDPLGEDRTYQLWVITSDELVISAGVLGFDPAPSRFTWSGEVAGFALTREVAGGVVTSAGDVVAVAEI